ncbi:MAG: hypothetical protein NC181_00535 [Clostridium sp.]|nr:hypothetical protein [Clostridium sp.]MCM1444751.1 hypothetical protein [Candidatus Amulumruptor caecigallinarius]
MDFDVVILGSDINAYYMARCCYEAYKIKPYLIAKEMMNFTGTSKILNISYESNLWDTDTFRKTLKNFAENHKGKKLILIGSNDFYIRLMVENKYLLERYYEFYSIDLELLNNLLIKDKFYTVFKDSELDFPNTCIYPCNQKKSISIKQLNSFKYPIILKPGNGVSYHKKEFSGQAKVYKLNSKKELLETIKKIEESGYDDNLIIQEFIPGDDTKLFDAIFFCDKNHNVTLSTFAQIGLQEHTKTGIGNCTVLVNGFSEFGDFSNQVAKMKKFLEDINYEGFAEFDMKYDERDGKYKVLEINPRQARSSYYLTACGFNLVEYMVDDLIYNKVKEYTHIDKKCVLSFVPKTVINKYIDNPILKKEIKNILRNNKIVNPLKCDLDKSIKRRLWLFVRKFNYIRKYAKNKW